MNNDQRILEDNYNIADESFLYYLHEKNQFNIESFWNLYDSIVELRKADCEEKFNMDLIRKLNFIYKSILQLFLYHMDSKDEYYIEKFPQEDYNLYIERLDGAIDGFYGGYEVKEELFELKRLN